MPPRSQGQAGLGRGIHHSGAPSAQSQGGDGRSAAGARAVFPGETACGAGPGAGAKLACGGMPTRPCPELDQLPTTFTLNRHRYLLKGFITAVPFCLLWAPGEMTAQKQRS